MWVHSISIRSNYIYGCNKGARALDEGVIELSPSPWNSRSPPPLSSSHFQVKTILDYAEQIYMSTSSSERGDAIWPCTTSHQQCIWMPSSRVSHTCRTHLLQEYTDSIIKLLSLCLWHNTDTDAYSFLQDVLLRYILEVHMSTIWPSSLRPFLNLSLLLGFPIWCNTDKAYDTILKSAYEGSKQAPVIAIQ